MKIKSLKKDNSKGEALSLYKRENKMKIIIPEDSTDPIIREGMKKMKVKIQMLKKLSR
jgi:predicted transcriptional regulator